MPDISSKIVFSLADLARIREKFTAPGAHHNNWNDEDIQDIRSRIRNFYRQQQNGRCAYCRKDLSIVSTANCQIEHVLSKAKYIQFVAEPLNLCVICADCNQIKRDQEVLNEVPAVTARRELKRYPRVSRSFLIVHPHFDNFEDHIFEVNGFYLDKTSKGGYTILFCKLNRRLHQFGYENAGIIESELLRIMDDYQKSEDGLEKAHILKKLQKAILLM